MVTQFRGLPVYDGGFAAQQPCPPGVKLCVRISSSNPVWPKRSSVETFMARLAFRGPAAIVRPDPTIKSYPPITPTGSDGPDPELVKLAASKGVDIAPGALPDMLKIKNPIVQSLARVSHNDSERESVCYCRASLQAASMKHALWEMVPMLLSLQTHPACRIQFASTLLPPVHPPADPQASTTRCLSHSRSGTSMPSHQLMTVHCTSCSSWARQMQLHGPSMQALFQHRPRPAAAAAAANSQQGREPQQPKDPMHVCTHARSTHRTRA